MKINVENVKALGPCENRFNNFVTNYPGFSGNLIDFLNLDNITYSDKAWVFVRLTTHVQNVRWSILCAESVLHIYESKYPNDIRPRKAIEAAEAFALNPCEETRQAAATATRAAVSAFTATTAVACASSSATGAALGAAAYAPAAAASAALGAAASAVASASAVYAPAAAAYAAAEKQQEELNLQFMILAMEQE